MMHPSGWGMGRSSFKIVISLAGGAAVGFLVFVLLEAALPGGHPANAGAVLFRFQVSSTIAMAIFAGLAILIYVRLLRSARDREPEKANPGRGRARK